MAPNQEVDQVYVYEEPDTSIENQDDADEDYLEEENTDEELGRDVQNPFILAYPEIMKIRRNNRNIDVNSGDFDSTFVVPEGFNLKEIVPEAPPTTTGPVTTSGGAGTTVTGRLSLDSPLARDIIGDDTLLAEIARRNT